VEQEVCGLGHQGLGGRRGEQRLDGLLAHLAGHVLARRAEHAGHVGVTRVGAAPRLEVVRQPARERAARAEAGGLAGVTGGAMRMAADEERVAVAVGRDLDHVQHVSRRGALHPARLP
jgi:hypothetical protein